jgi:hypothetical protein
MLGVSESVRRIKLGRGIRTLVLVLAVSLAASLKATVTSAQECPAGSTLVTDFSGNVAGSNIVGAGKFGFYTSPVATTPVLQAGEILVVKHVSFAVKDVNATGKLSLLRANLRLCTAANDRQNAVRAYSMLEPLTTPLLFPILYVADKTDSYPIYIDNAFQSYSLVGQPLDIEMNYAVQNSDSSNSHNDIWQVTYEIAICSG